MRAVVVTEPGGVDALTLVDLPAPTPGPDEVVLDVVVLGFAVPVIPARRSNTTLHQNERGWHNCSKFSPPCLDAVRGR